MALGVAQDTTYQNYLKLYRSGDSTAIDALRVFSKSVPLTSNTNGLITYPTDFGYLQQAYIQNGSEFNIIKQILDSEFSYYTQSKIMPIATNPTLQQQIGGLQIYPNTIYNILLNYIKKPDTPYMAYYINSNNELVGITGTGFQITVTSVSAGAITGVSASLPMGSGYVDGTYTNIPLITQTGSGSGGVVTFTVSGGAVVSISGASGGTGYSNGNKLTIDSSVELGFAQPFWIEIMNLALMYIGINLSQQELLQVIGGMNK